MTNDSSDQTPQPQFKTDEAIRAMANLMAADKQSDSGNSTTASGVYEPCCGSGGFLYTTIRHLFATENAGSRIADYCLVNPPFAGT